MESLSPRQLEVFQALRSFIEETGYPPTMRDLARKLGIVNPTAVKRMLDIFEEKGLLETASGKSRAIRLKYPSQSKAFPEEIIPLPVAGRIVAGMAEEAIQEIEEKIPVPSFLTRNNPKSFLLKVKGNSMEPEFHEGDLLIIHPQPDAKPNDLVAAMVEGEATVKQLMRDNGVFFLHPLNPDYPDIPMDDRFQIIGTVTGLLRQF